MWEDVAFKFSHTFKFLNDNPIIHSALHEIHAKVLEIVLVELPMESQKIPITHLMSECCNVTGGLDDDDDLWNINIPEMEGSWDVLAPDVPMDPMNQPLKIRKVNIGMEENPKFATIAYYWDEETM